LLGKRDQSLPAGAMPPHRVRRRGALRRALEALSQQAGPTTPTAAAPMAAAAASPAHPRFVRAPRFVLPAQREQMLAFLALEGYAVVAAALTDAEAAEALERTWRFIEGAGTGVDRCDTATWGDDRWPLGAGSSPFSSPQRSTIPELGHSEQLWYVRGCPGVRAAWASILETDDLITSFDGMSIYRPWSETAAHEQASSWRTDGPWYHTDQPPYAPAGRPASAQPVGFQREYIQGFVNLVSNSELTGGQPTANERARFRFESSPFYQETDDPGRKNWKTDREVCLHAARLLGNCVIPRSHTEFEAAVRGHWTEEQGLSRPWEGEVLADGVIADCRAGDLFLWCVS
jgi:hypothetical protein